MTYNILKIILKQWGLTLPEEKIREVHDKSKVAELKKGDMLTLPADTLLIVLTGIVEIENSLYTSGDIVYTDVERTCRCVSGECTVLYVDTKALESIINKLLIERLCRVTRIVKSKTVEDVPVKLFIRKLPVVASPDSTLRHVTKLMSEHGVSSVVVVDEQDRPIGILTDTDIRRLYAQQTSPETRLRDVALKQLITVREDTSTSSVLEQMLFNGIKHMIVTDGTGKITGIVTLRDLYNAYTAIPVALMRELQRCSTVEELLIYYSRILRQSVNIVLRKKVDVEEFSRNFTLVRTLILSRILSIHFAQSEDIVVLVGTPMSIYDYVFGQEATVYIVGRDVKLLDDVAIKLRTCLSKMLDIAELTKIETLTTEELREGIQKCDSTICLIPILSRPIWGNAKLIDDIVNIGDENFASKVIKLIRKVCDEIEVPLDILGRIKYRIVDLCKHVLTPIEMLLQLMYYLTTRSRANMQVQAMLEVLKQARIVGDDFANSLFSMYVEVKHLALRTAVKNYLERAKPSCEVNIEELSDAEIEHVRLALELVKELKHRVRELASRHTAV